MYRRGRVAARVLAALAVTAAGASLLSACSPGADYPSLFPAIHDMPPPRADSTLDPAQVQQATEDLITARDHLNAEAPPTGQEKSPDKGTNSAATKNGSKTGPKNAADKKPAAAKPPAPSGSEAAAPAAARTAQTAGADTKP